MWFRKQKPEPLECRGCGCLMREAWKTVKVEIARQYGYADGTSDYIFVPPWPSKEYFCGVCAPPYDVRSESDKVRYYRKEPARNVEITEKGKAIS